MSAADDLTLRELVGGVLWPGFFGRSVPDWLRHEFDAGLAGAVLFSHNLAASPRHDTPDFADFRPGLLVGIDEEGGGVTRLDPNMGSTPPGAAQLGYVDDVDTTRAVGQALAERSLAVGANVVLGPVADVNTNLRNPVIGVRSFGETPDLVARHVAATVRGIQDTGAAACAKHFPGHGDAHVDSHHALPTLAIDAAEIERMHLPPFRAAIEAGVRAVMTGHLVVPEWGEQPATLNPAVLGRLRAMGFEGVIVTDALDMAAVRTTVGMGPGAVQALLAGADLLCIGNPRNPGPLAAHDQDLLDFREVQRAVLAAIADGTLPVAVLERAGERVRALAASVADATRQGERMPLDGARVAVAAITTDGDIPAAQGPRTVLDVRRRPTLAIDDADDIAAALAAGGRVVRIEAGEVPAEVTRSVIERVARGAGVAADATAQLVVLADVVGSPGAQRDVIEQLAGIRRDAIVVNVGMPGGGLPLAALHLRAASLLAAEAARDVLAAGVRA